MRSRSVRRIDAGTRNPPARLRYARDSPAGRGRASRNARCRPRYARARGAPSGTPLRACAGIPATARATSATSHAPVRGERDSRRSIAPSRKLWTALRALNRYLIGQSAWLVNYAERHRAGLRVGTTITEGTANFLVNRRMSKSQQIRWSRRGADHCFRFGARSIMVRSAPNSGGNSTQPTAHSRQSLLPPDPQLCTSPVRSRVRRQTR
jgi:hypothetical protein